MRKLLAFLICIVLKNPLYAQPKNMVFIIKSIEFLSEKAQEDFSILLFNNNSKSIFDEEVVNIDISKNRFPNLISEFTLNADSAFIEISLDTLGGVLQILGLNSIETDTLRIDKFLQISPCYNDTLFTQTWYYKMYKDSLAEKAHRIKRKSKIIKSDCLYDVENYQELRINDQHYFVKKVKKRCDEEEMVSGHGYLPDKRFNRIRKKGGDYKGRVRYMYFKSLLIRNCNFFSVELKAK